MDWVYQIDSDNLSVYRQGGVDGGDAEMAALSGRLMKGLQKWRPDLFGDGGGKDEL